MARLMKNFIGGIASRVVGSYEEIVEEETLQGEEDKKPLENSEDVTSDEINEEEEDGIMIKVGSGEETEKGSFTSEEENNSVDSETMNEQPTIRKPPSKMGPLSKWANYLLGWQDRYVVVRDGVLSYYKSEFDLQYGCRGSVSLHKVRVLVSVEYK